MNDLYTQDRLARNDSDFGGSGVAAGHYTPQEEFKEKLGEVKLPAILFAFAALCFCILIFLTVREINLYNNGTAVEAKIGADSNVGTFIDDSGTIHTADIGWANVKNSDGTVTVYYKGSDYAHAQAITSWWVYLISYLFFGGLFGLVIFWMYRILHKTSHAVKAGVSENGYRSKFDE